MSAWQKFQKRVQICGVVFALLHNLLLIFLVIKKSHKEFGTYKNLIIIVAISECIFAVLEVTVRPIFHSFGSTFALIVNVEDSLLEYGVLKVLLSVYCAFFGSFLVIFSIQFIYRYWAVSGNKHLKKFEGLKILLWSLPPILCGFIWGFVAYFPCAKRPSTDEYLKESVRKEFNLNIEEILYAAPYFFENISVITVFYFGIKCYSSLRAQGTLVSQYTQKLQSQLFYSLVIQTLIPLFLMHIPVSAMYSFTFLEIDVGSLTGIVTVTLAIFPAIDPLPTLIMVKSYRTAIQLYIYSFFKAITKIVQPQVNSIALTQTRVI